MIDRTEEMESNAAPLQLQVAERSYGSEPLAHHHDFVQVLLPARGYLALECEEERGWVGGGQLAVLPPGALHRYYAERPNQIVVADLPAEHPGAAPILEQRGAFRPQDARLICLTATLRAEARTGGLEDPLLADALLHYLLAALAATSRDSSAPAVGSRQRCVVAAAEAYLGEHFRQPLTVAEVAAAVGVSASHLQRAFRAETGSTLVAHVHHLRLTAAATLLRESDATVLAIAHQVGFASQSHLTRAFTRQFGCAPGRYRTRVRGGREQELA